MTERWNGAAVHVRRGSNRSGAIRGDRFRVRRRSGPSRSISRFRTGHDRRWRIDHAAATHDSGSTSELSACNASVDDRICKGGFH
jgi:hypothetical protein